MLAFGKDFQIMLHFKRAVHKFSELRIAEFHLLSHIGAVGVSNLSFPVAKFCQNLRLLFAVEEKIENMVVTLFNFPKALLQ